MHSFTWSWGGGGGEEGFHWLLNPDQPVSPQATQSVQNVQSVQNAWGPGEKGIQAEGTLCSGLLVRPWILCAPPGAATVACVGASSKHPDSVLFSCWSPMAIEEIKSLEQWVGLGSCSLSVVWGQPRLPQNQPPQAGADILPSASGWLP